MRVAIAGAGNVGQHVAASLHEAGHEVLLIEQKDAVKARATLDAGVEWHVGDACEVSSLREAGLGLAADGVESMKKDLLVNTALARLKGTRWLPAPLRPPLA